MTKFLIKKALKLLKNKFDPTTMMAMDGWMDGWNHTGFMCMNYILNELDNTLYDVYSSIKNAKELREVLNKNHKVEDASVKRFIVIKFLDLKMVISISIVSQVQESLLILQDIHAESMYVNDSFQVAGIIEKL
jgi:hypothetical protein